MRTTNAKSESWYRRTRSLKASRSPPRARSRRMRSRRWTGSSVTVVERRSSTVGGSLRTAILRLGESSIGSGRDADTCGQVPYGTAGKDRGDVRGQQRPKDRQGEGHGRVDQDLADLRGIERLAERGQDAESRNLTERA